MKRFLYLFFITTIYSQPEIPTQSCTLAFLKKNNIDTRKIRLHLGCGENNIPGYINIDFKSDHHPLQTRQRADFFGDIQQLSFPQSSIAEIRSHHTFEHFNRQTALALLASWYYWLVPDGIVIIETPDFERSIKQLCSNEWSHQEKQAIVRHIFGSHEASWAIHYDGWSASKFDYTLSYLGFSKIKLIESEYLMLRNITVAGYKKDIISRESLRKKCHDLLKEYTINNTPSEIALWQIWCAEFDVVFNNLCQER